MRARAQLKVRVGTALSILNLSILNLSILNLSILNLSIPNLIVIPNGRGILSHAYDSSEGV